MGHMQNHWVPYEKCLQPPKQRPSLDVQASSLSSSLKFTHPFVCQSTGWPIPFTCICFRLYSYLSSVIMLCIFYHPSWVWILCIGVSYTNITVLHAIPSNATSQSNNMLVNLDTRPIQQKLTSGQLLWNCQTLPRISNPSLTKQVEAPYMGVLKGFKKGEGVTSPTKPSRLQGIWCVNCCFLLDHIACAIVCLPCAASAGLKLSRIFNS